MDNNIFRQKSIKEMQSPDNLKEYIKVVNPGIWFVCVACLLLLIGVFIWGVFGRVEDKVAVTAVCQNGVLLCEYNEKFKNEMPAVFGDSKGSVVSVSSAGTKIKVEDTLSDGIYSGYVIVGEISPVSFIFN